MLHENPEQWDKFVHDPDGMIAGAVEEMLRWSSPVMYLRRNVTVDTEAARRDLARATKVALAPSRRIGTKTSSRTRSASTSNATRTTIGFGAPGPHFCLGASPRSARVCPLHCVGGRFPVLVSTGAPAYLRSNVVAGSSTSIDLGLDAR